MCCIDRLKPHPQLGHSRIFRQFLLWVKAAVETAPFTGRPLGKCSVREQGVLAKTDPLDARIIAEFIAFRPDVGRHPPSKTIREISALSAKRRQLVEMRKRLSCQIKQRHMPALDALDHELLGLLNRQIADLETCLSERISAEPRIAKTAEILSSIPGIGPVLTAGLIGALPELGYCSDKEIAALAGVAPIDNASGKKDGRRSIRGGRYDIRCLLYQAALVASHHNPPLTDFAKRLKNKGKPHKLVLIAVARKLLIVANTLIRKQQKWTSA